MKCGFCLWRVYSVSGEMCLTHIGSVSRQPKWEHDLSGIILFVWLGLRCSQKSFKEDVIWALMVGLEQGDILGG